jgi:hypothetical protein
MRDPSLSLKSKGLLMYFLTHKVGYVITLSQIERETNDGKTAIRTAITELENAGYLVVEQTRTEKGYNAGLSYTLQDPEFEFQTATNSEPESENPKLENPKLENPKLENRIAIEEQLLNKNKLEEEQKSKKQTKTEKLQKAFAIFWEIYPNKDDEHLAYKRFAIVTQLISPETIYDGARRYRDDPNRQEFYTKKAYRWLDGECWTNGPLPARPTNDRQQRIQQAQANFLAATSPKQEQIDTSIDWDFLK